ncbi:polysaccharide pyruvyl transferase CsaB [Paenibacillus sp. GCM10012307]|uniref:Polysaccharide pyruvyl transferase CsaB n=1 Tax=Paenibacillus roseus TaxID=2798579 RepID=A0A934J5G5_9BACL|nr:polysaccharide pyruvyl transferase CsaB [Paenibacillus roseus]MBJ6361908.1 polysaccharide pyruvyl transferase CsaB [Paenibacillus roseus]
MGIEASQVFRIAISGYYGFRNSGDEAVLKSILLALDECGQEAGIRIQPIVLSIDPEWTSGMYGVEAVHRMQPKEVISLLRASDGLLSGGGSLLQDATSAKTIPYYAGIIKLAQWLGKPTFIYSQGVGPVNRGWMNPLIRSAMKASRYVSVRDKESAELLDRIGVPLNRIEVVPDPVMGLPLPEQEASGADRHSHEPVAGGREPVIGISLRFWRKDRADLDRIAGALLELLGTRDVQLRFLPFHTPEDVEAAAYVIGKLGASGAGKTDIREAGDDPQRMLHEVSQCDVLLGMRLHALIYAANMKVPLLGISYDPKIDQFLGRLQLKPIGTTESLDSAAFVSHVTALIDNASGWVQSKNDIIDQLKQESRQPARQIVNYLRELKR